MSIMLNCPFETTYNEYYSFTDRDNLEISAYRVLNHFFQKFEYVFRSFPSLKRVIENCKTDIDSSLGLCYDLYYVQYEISLCDLDANEDRNAYLRQIQIWKIIQDAMVVECIVKYEICNIFRFSQFSEAEASDMRIRTLTSFKKKFYEIQRDKIVLQREYSRKYQAELLRKKEIRQNVNILCHHNLVCKDVAHVICQYLI